MSAFMHRGVINVNFTFSSAMICRTTVCWDPGILLPWQRDVTTSPPYWSVSEHKLDKMPYQLQNKLKRTKKRDCLSRKSSVKSALPTLFNCRHDRNCVTIRTKSAQTRIAKTSIAPEKILLAACTNRGSPCELKSESLYVHSNVNYSILDHAAKTGKKKKNSSPMRTCAAKVYINTAHCLKQVSFWLY